MKFKIGDKIRFNNEGLKIYKHCINSLSLDYYYGKIIKIEENPYVAEEKLITYKTIDGNEYQIRSIYLENGGFDYHYQCRLFNDYLELNIPKSNILFSEISRMTLKLTEDIINNEVDKEDVDYFNELYLLSKEFNFSDDFMTHFEEVKEAVEKIISSEEFIYSNPNYYQFTMYLLKDDLYKVVKIIMESLEYKKVEKFTAPININDKDKFYEYSFEGVYQDKKVKIKKRIMKEELK